MRSFTKSSAKMIAVLAILGMTFTPATAQSLKASDMANSTISTKVKTNTRQSVIPAIVIRAVVMGTITAVGAGANSYNNGGSAKTIAKAAVIGFVTGSVGGVVSKKLK